MSKQVQITLVCLIIALFWLAADFLSIIGTTHIPSSVLDREYLVDNFSVYELIPLANTILSELLLIFIIHYPIVWLIYRVTSSLQSRFLAILLVQLVALAAASLSSNTFIYVLIADNVFNWILLPSYLFIFFYLIQHRIKVAVFILLIGCSGFSSKQFEARLPDNNPLDVTHNSKPNVFYIGVDSLRLDVFDQAEGGFFQEIREQGAYFTNIYTPMARTHVALTSMLTGLQPIEHGARFNLMTPNSCAITRSLPNQLKDLGYQSIFAMDERRFSNISEDYGFDQTVGPVPGSSEMILSKLINNPWAVLLNHSIWVRNLFGYRSLNRNRVDMYTPSIFNQQILQEIDDVDGPIFAHTHFTLGHWPYVPSPEPQGEVHVDDNYLFAIKEVEDQVGSYVNTLKERGLLDNAIVYFYSDHGESIKMADEPIGYLDDHRTDTGNGHGTDVLSSAQYRVLVVYLRYIGGKSSHIASKHNELGSLTKVYQSTLQNIAETDSKELLLPKLDIESIYLETGRTSLSLYLDQIDPEKVISENLTQFRLDGARVVFDDQKVISELAKKQVARVMETGTLGYFGQNNCFKFYDNETDTLTECLPRQDLSVELASIATNLEKLTKIRDTNNCELFNHG